MLIIFSLILFFVGAFGLFLTRKHIIMMLLSLEIVLLSINYNFLIFSVMYDDVLGQIYVLCILTLAAAESAIGLAILVVYYRLRGGISLDLVNLLKG